MLRPFASSPPAAPPASIVPSLAAPRRPPRRAHPAAEKVASAGMAAALLLAALHAVPAAAEPAAPEATAPAAAAPAAAAPVTAGPAAAAPPSGRFTQGAVDVTVTRAPEKRLDFEVVVPATLDEVWQAFTTADGLVTWLSPAAKVELRLGGLWEAGFHGAKPGGGTILSFLPREMLAVAALAPEAFPTVRRERTQAVFRFEAVDAAHTRVRLSQIGWQSGQEWDDAFAYLAKGNAQLLNSLHQRFAAGPVDWRALLGARQAPGS
jgi:uncharacterized protein YndB with AHSA1/START domain